MISSDPIIDCTESKQYIIYAADIPSTNLFLDQKIFIKDFGVFFKLFPFYLWKNWSQNIVWPSSHPCWDEFDHSDKTENF